MEQEANRTVTASSGGGQIPVWTTASGDGDRPGVLLVPAIFGVDEGAKKLARDLADAGAHVWAVDPFWRTSPGVIAPRDSDGFAKAMARAREVDDELATADFADVIRAIAREEGCNGNVAVVGLCFAGKFALLLTSQGHAAGGASFHGTRLAAMAPLAAQIDAPLSLHFGDEDVATSVGDVEVLRKACEGRDNVDVILHEGGVKHGFADPGSDGFNPSVAKVVLGAMSGLLDKLR